MKKYIPFLPLVILFFLSLTFFGPFIFRGKLPIPADTIVGMYHPFRDYYAHDFPRGVPFKNSLITDPVRQQYPWKELAIEIIRRGELPLWNSYTFSGAPLLANLQSGVFYPLNLVFLISPFYLSWSFFILLQPILAALFAYLFLSNLKLNRQASFLGAFVFAFSGFSIAWMEWGNIIHTALWLPLILLSIDKITIRKKERFWGFVFVLAMSSSFFAGHLQTFFYILIFTLCYFIARWWNFGRNKVILSRFVALTILSGVITSVVWLPAFRFISLSARGADLIDWHNPAWFIPFQNLTQFIAPDFFGNPATLNYWGIWNYGEFIGYIGIFPLIMAFFALFSRRDKKTMFFGLVFLLSLLFALPTFLAKIPYKFNLPFISTSQPTRLIFLTDFSLSVLSALGLDLYLKNRKKIIFPVAFIALIIIALWIFLRTNKTIPPQDLTVSRQNMILPTALFVLCSSILLLVTFFKKQKRLINFIPYLLIIITVFDLFRFGWKFTPFSDPGYLFPSTSAISFLKGREGIFRIMATDSRILPPNFSTVYRIQSVDGYDPLYLFRYGELMAAQGRQKPDISTPFGFNRIITPQHPSSRIIDLLGVKYVLSINEVPDQEMFKVFSEGNTQVYENKRAFKRAFFVERIKKAEDKNEAIKSLFDLSIDLRKTAIVENWNGPDKFRIGILNIKKYSENRVVIGTSDEGEGFLVLTDSYYPTWHAAICDTSGNNCKETPIFRTDYNFRGVVVPAGEHNVEFFDTLL